MELRGFVLQPDGFPAAAARVEAFPGGQLLAETSSNGEFLLVLDEPSMTIVGRYGEQESVPVVVSPIDVDRNLIVRLRELSQISVLVVDATSRRALSGAIVMVKRGSMLLEEQRTDEDGRARLSLRESGKLTLSARAEGFGSASRRVATSWSSSSSHLVTLALPPRVIVQGTITDRSGTTVRGVSVTAWEISGGEPVAESTTEGDGSFTFHGLYPGTFRFRAFAEDLGAADSEVMELRPPQRIVNLVLGNGRVVSGLVLDGGNAPVEGARIHVSVLSPGRFHMPERRSVTTDENGRFRIVNAPASEIELLATHEDAASAPATLSMDQLEPVTLHLRQGLAIEGHVQDSNGNRLPNVIVAARASNPEQARPRGAGVKALTGPEGTFRILGLAQGDWNLSAQAPDDLIGSARRQDRVLKVAAAGSRDIVLELLGTGAIEGWVEFDDKTIPQALTVLVSGFDVAIPASGSFLLEGVPAGTYNLWFTGPEFQPTEVSSVEVRSGDTTALEGVVVRHGRTANGTVRNSQGAPVANAKVVASRRVKARADTLSYRRVEEEPELRVTYTDDLGRFELSGLLDGDMAIMAEHPDHGRSQARPLGALNQGPLELPLGPTHQIDGHVSRSGEPLPGFAVVAEAPGGLATFATITDGSGRYMLAGVPADEYFLAAARRGDSGSLEIQRKKVVVGDRRSHEVDFEFESKTVSVGVEVIGGGNGVVLRGRSVYSQQTSTGGLYRLDRVVPGSYSVCVMAQSGRSDPGADNCVTRRIDDSPDYQVIRF